MPRSHQLKILIFLVLFLTVVFMVVIWNRDFISIDICLDHGGRWDYKNSTCNY